jgi:hypothetical protein
VPEFQSPFDKGVELAPLLAAQCGESETKQKKKQDEVMAIRVVAGFHNGHSR